MPGLTLLNCVIAGVGIVLIYLIMPETENRTLEDIEMHFSDNSKKITDRKIARIVEEPDLELNDEHNSVGTGVKGRDNVGFENDL